MKSGRDPILKIIRFWNTIKYLRPEQTFGRIWYLLRRKIFISKFGKEIIKKSLSIINEAPITEKISFCFLNKTSEMPCSEIKWLASDYKDSEIPEKLWLYNLNYFEWLKQADFSIKAQKTAIFHWITNNSDSRLESWEPYPTSLRLISWCEWFISNKNELNETEIGILLQAIYIQLKQLVSNFEYHNQANHLMSNLCAALISCVFLSQNKINTEDILEQTINELEFQIEFQILPDGGHFECCPSYHLEMMKLIGKAKQSAENYSRNNSNTMLNEKLNNLIQLCENSLKSMQNWINCLTHPNNTLAMFGDTGFVETKKENKCEQAVILKNSGYFIYRDESIYFAIKLIGPTPDIQPGHSHCDLLSFELSVGKEKAVTDTGTGSYQNIDIRNHCRSSYSHNIPMVEGTEQSDIYGAFRVGKRAELLTADYDEKQKTLFARIQDQYGQVFSRTVTFQKNAINFIDKLEERKITGTFISLIHLQSNNIIDIMTETKRIHRIPHTIYTDFGKPAEAEKIVLSNGEESEIRYAIRWKKA